MREAHRPLTLALALSLGLASPALAAPPWAIAEGGEGSLLHTPNAPDDPAPVEGPVVVKGTQAGRRATPTPSPNLLHTPNAPDDPAPVEGPVLVKSPAEPDLNKDIDALVEDAGSVDKNPASRRPLPSLNPWPRVGLLALGGLTSGVPVAYLAAGDGLGALRSGVVMNVGLGAALAFSAFASKAISLEDAARIDDEAQFAEALMGPGLLPVAALGVGLSGLGALDLAGQVASGRLNAPTVLGAGVAGFVGGAALSHFTFPQANRDAERLARRKR